ncbi:MAG: sensor histidine kinase [Rhodovulum sulfidophilum]|uniref:histidine kinase n=1 Tax=Rhodovulum sulfidophilum TaxID=35806 RepID=A0A2W5Q2K1_RHOSU|nr:MAG: sensor histidine kinase [Rhodovulum sulfidophilum]
MIRDSIRLRLVVAGTAAVIGALGLAAFGLDLLFERHVERRAVAEMLVDLDQLTAGLGRDAAGALEVVRPPPDPRYAQPLSGYYWQVDVGDGAPLRSRSLWDGALTLPDGGPPPGVARPTRMNGPDGVGLLAVERTLMLRRGAEERPARTVVAMDRRELRAATRAFVGDLVPYVALLGAVLIGAGALQLAVGLRPLAAVGARVAAVRSGEMRRLGDDFPAEVRPLAAEVDALIEEREAELARARGRAADLAHGLKTPLQALIGEADLLRARGDAEGADGIEEIALAMRAHVDRELARARVAAAARAAVCDPARVVERLLAVLRRTPDGGRLTWTVAAEPGLRARIDADDLTEALGALLENAARHADDAVALRITAGAGRVVIAVEDDGPGIPPEQLEALMARGVRLDRAGPGAGLGLSIASEIAAAAGGALTLMNGANGLVARFDLPEALGPT